MFKAMNDDGCLHLNDNVRQVNERRGGTKSRVLGNGGNETIYHLQFQKHKNSKIILNI